MSKIKIEASLSLEKKFGWLQRKLNESVSSASRLIQVVRIAPDAATVTLSNQFQGFTAFLVPLTWPAGATYARVTAICTATATGERLIASKTNAAVWAVSYDYATSSVFGQAGIPLFDTTGVFSVNPPSITTVGFVPNGTAADLTISIDSNAAAATFSVPEMIISASIMVEFYSGTLPTFS